MKITNIIQELHYDRTDIFEVTYVNKTTKSKDCDICLYCYFLNKGFKFQSYVCSRCQYLLIMSMNLKDIYILNIKNADYCCIISGISKSKAIKLFQNNDLIEKAEPY